MGEFGKRSTDDERWKDMGTMEEWNVGIIEKAHSSQLIARREEQDGRGTDRGTTVTRSVARTTASPGLLPQMVSVLFDGNHICGFPGRGLTSNAAMVS